MLAVYNCVMVSTLGLKDMKSLSFGSVVYIDVLKAYRRKLNALKNCKAEKFLDKHDETGVTQNIVKNY